jgi:hypothetical protein
MIPLILAPVLAKLAENGLNILAGAITAKGKDVVEKTLGLDIDKASQTEEGLITLRQLEVQHEEFLITAAQKKAETDLKDKELTIQNTANAQNMNTKIQESANASKIAKEGPYYLDFLVVGSTLILATILLFNGVPPVNKELVYMAFGSLVTMCGTILNFHRGSSQGSKDNGDAVRKALGDNQK